MVPILGALCIEKLGWRPTLLIFAIPIALMGIVTFVLMQPEAVVAGRGADGPDRGLMTELREMLRRPNIKLVLLASTVAAGGRGLGVVMTYIPAYLQDPQRGLHLGQLSTGALFNVLLIGSVAGTMLAGRISDHFGRKRTLIIAYGLALLGMALVIVTGPNLILLVPVLLFVGLTAFAESPLRRPSSLTPLVPVPAHRIRSVFHDCLRHRRDLGGNHRCHRAVLWLPRCICRHGALLPGCRIGVVADPRPQPVRRLTPGDSPAPPRQPPTVPDHRAIRQPKGLMPRLRGRRRIASQQRLVGCGCSKH